MSTVDPALMGSLYRHDPCGPSALRESMGHISTYLGVAVAAAAIIIFGSAVQVQQARHPRGSDLGLWQRLPYALGSRRTMRPPVHHPRRAQSVPHFLCNRVSYWTIYGYTPFGMSATASLL